MKISEAGKKEKQIWNAFALENQGDFLQSWEWGDFQASTGKKIWRLAAEENREIIGIVLIIKHDFPFGKNYLYCPRGPVVKIPNPNYQNPNKSQIPITKILNLFLEKTKEIAKKEKSVFLKIEPVDDIGELPEGTKMEIAGNIQPKDTLILDLAKSEENLLAEMKQKTRYNIKLASKNGVRIRASDKNTLAGNFEKFWALVSETSKRDKFQSHPKKYYQDMLNILDGAENDFSRRPLAKLFLAEYQDKTLAANIIVFFGRRTIYLHGASSSENRNLMAPYLLQWEQIKKARNSGCKEYDFWGIDPRAEKNWGGITRFKKGFGGREINYPGAIDFIYQPRLYRAIKIVKKIKFFRNCLRSLFRREIS